MGIATRIRLTVARDQVVLVFPLLAFVLSLPALGYGLPLLLVGDEPPFVLAALQMIQLHTLIPSLHADAFKSILYYPPYIAYAYVPFFSAILAVKYVVWHGTAAQFIARLSTDLSAFFIAARFISAAASAAGVYLLYRIAEALFESRLAARFAAFLFATSLLREGLSMTGRHWTAVTLIFLIVLYILTRPDMPERRRYFWALVTAGVGMGFSTISVFAAGLAGLWYFFFGTMPLREAVRDRQLWLGVVLFGALAILPSLLYDHSNTSLSGTMTLSQHKSLLGLLASFVAMLRYTLFSEPVLTAFAGIGVLYAFVERRRLLGFFASYFFAYTTLFYLTFLFVARYALPLVPVYALLGGYAAARLWSMSRTVRVGLCLLLIVPLLVATRLSVLAYENDTRYLARQWSSGHLTTADKVLVYAGLTRLPVDSRALSELRALDSSAVRRTDEAEASTAPVGPTALNLYTVTDMSVFATLPAYATSHGYTYLIIDPDLASTAEEKQAFAAIEAHATPVVRWMGLKSAASIGDSQFLGSFIELFSGRLLGPDIVIYKLDTSMAR